MKQQLTAVSLFAGVGGFDLALERNGINVVAAVEIDNNARGVLKHRFPNTELFTDVMEVTGDQLINAGFNPDRGIIVGGFPCQDLSVAGRRAGLDGARSGLFWQICRLLDETKARYFILENVPGLLSSNDGRDMGAVVGALVERGYGVSYRVLDAQHFGVAQRRRRVFIVGSLGGHWGAPSEILDLRQGRRGHLEASDKARKGTSGSATSGARRGGIGSDLVGSLNASDYKFPQQQQVHENKIVVQGPALGSGKDVANALCASLYHHGTVVNQDANNGHVVIQPYPRPYPDGVTGDYRLGNRFDALTYAKSRRAQNVDDFETWVENDVTPTLNVFDNHTETRATELIVAPTVIAIQNTVIGRKDTAGPQGKGYADDGEPMFTIDTTSAHAISTDSTVRRLTPTECERLQGFPDGWTSERYDFKKNAVIAQADSNRYKQMGNAVAVPVVQWIISRLVEVDRDQA